MVPCRLSAACCALPHSLHMLLLEIMSLRMCWNNHVISCLPWAVWTWHVHAMSACRAQHAFGNPLEGRLQMQ